MTIDLGIYVNNRAAVFLGEAYSLDRLLDAAILADSLDFNFVSVGDSILAKPRYMPIPVLSAIAARTQQIALSTGILQPHMRHPVLLAQEWATLDELSNGRTILAVGLGTGDPKMVEKEYKVMGLSKAKRGIAFEESIVLLKQLWTEEHVTFAGQVFQLEDVSLGYRPRQRPHPPIVIACGGYVPKEPGTGPNDFYRREIAGTFHGPFERVARLGDGWITGIITPDEYRQTLELIRIVAREKYNRTLDTRFRRVLNCFINVSDDPVQARQVGVRFLENYHRRPFDNETVERWLIYGSPERCAARINEYIAACVSSFQFVLADEDQLGQIQRIAEQVRPLLSAAVPLESLPLASAVE
jgi:alkanesulfonate monooxygenase SsuD/methylene tetrahydromethanopterin reductase-like flavin-dependent oxidoreductase (luciferase family)